MDSAGPDTARCADLLYLEADLLDRRQWDDWAALYTDDCVVWVPSWDTEEALVSEPEFSVNMMYLVGKAALQARLHRLRSEDTYAARPPAWTSHAVANVRIVGRGDDGIEVSAKWTVLSLEPRRGKSWRGGWYDHLLVLRDDRLMIRRKKITLLEDIIDGPVDIHQL